MTVQIAEKGHNLLAEYAETVRECFTTARESTREALTSFINAGSALNAAKAELAGEGKGAFGRWCDDAGFPFAKTWRARLMKLAGNATAIIGAVEALPEEKRNWSVNGALKIWRDSNRDPHRTPVTRLTINQLRTSLAEAQQRIAKLEAQAKRRKGALSAPRDAIGPAREIRSLFPR